MRESDFEIFETVAALVVVFDRDGRIAYWNQRCSELTGYSLEEARGRNLWDFVLVSEEVEAVKAIFATPLGFEHPSSYANYWLTRAGERRWIAWSLISTRAPDGRFRYRIETGIDRTESKEALDALLASAARLDLRAAEAVRLYEASRRAAEELREANQHMVSATIRAQEMTETVEAALVRSEDSARELRAVAELRERFLGIVGHDLRNPLGAITMTADTLLHRGKLDERDQKAVSRIAASTGRMSRMILQLLDFTRARLGGGFPLDVRPTDLREVCRSVVDELGAAVRLEVDGALTGTWDPDRLAEALSNIGANAVDYAKPGTTVVLKAHLEGAEVVVEIINQGEPISADVLPFIFEPFRQNRTDRSPAGHLGLGLYIARQIVLASGGTLGARSVGGTTTFLMRLPRGAPAARAPSSRAEARP